MEAIKRHLLRAILFLVFLSLSCKDSDGIIVQEGMDKTNTPSFIIRTPTATYHYQKEAGGFSTILDVNGRDWIQYNRSDSIAVPRSADSDFRGLPNLVYKSEDGGAGHPGFSKMVSTFVPPNRIESVSKSGKWAWHWDFFDDHAELTIDERDAHTPYWFLYEGPVGGKFEPLRHFWGSDATGLVDGRPDLMRGEELLAHMQTAYFGTKGYSPIFFVHQTEKDDEIDHFAYMGNSKAGIHSKDGMVVFGFGRDKGAKPLLRAEHKFRIGFLALPHGVSLDHHDILQKIKEPKR